MTRAHIPGGAVAVADAAVADELPARVARGDLPAEAVCDDVDAALARAARGLTAVVRDDDLGRWQRRQLLRRARDLHIPTAALLHRRDEQEEGRWHADGADVVADRSAAFLPDARGVDHPGCDVATVWFGDVHGHAHSLDAALAAAGFAPDFSHPDDKVAGFVGDLVNKGAHSFDVLGRVRHAHRLGRAIVVAGNHERALQRRLESGSRRGGPEMRRTLRTIDRVPRRDDLVAELLAWLERLPAHVVLEHGRFVASHAGVPAALVGEDSEEAVRAATWGDNDPGWPHDYDGTPDQVHGNEAVDTATRTVAASGAVVVNVDTSASGKLSWYDRATDTLNAVGFDVRDAA